MSRAYTLLYRPPSTFTLPRGIGWTLVERPSLPGLGFDLRTDLPISRYPFGLVVFDREVTPEEIERFDLEPVDVERP